MPLTKPNQDFKRYLQGIASDLKWSEVELMRTAERRGTRLTPMPCLCFIMLRTGWRGDAEDLKMGQFVRGKADCFTWI